LQKKPFVVVGLWLRAVSDLHVFRPSAGEG